MKEQSSLIFYHRLNNISGDSLTDRFEQIQFTYFMYNTDIHSNPMYCTVPLYIRIYKYAMPLNHCRSDKGDAGEARDENVFDPLSIEPSNGCIESSATLIFDYSLLCISPN